MDGFVYQRTVVHVPQSTQKRGCKGVSNRKNHKSGQRCFYMNLYAEAEAAAAGAAAAATAEAAKALAADQPVQPVQPVAN